MNKKIYLLWAEKEGIEVFNNFDDAVRVFVTSEAKNKAIIKIEPLETINYAYDRFNISKYIIANVIPEVTIWKRAYELQKEG